MVCPKCGMNIALDREPSRFDGKLIQLIGWEILAFFVTLLTLGICYPWALCKLYGWRIKHTIINGRRLRFDGTGLQLFGSWVKWWLLSLITLGIYGWWIPIKVNQWTAKHTHLVDTAAAPVLAEPDQADRPVLPAASARWPSVEPSDADEPAAIAVVMWIFIVLSIACVGVEIIAGVVLQLLSNMVFFSVLCGAVVCGAVAWALVEKA